MDHRKHSMFSFKDVSQSKTSELFLLLPQCHGNEPNRCGKTIMFPTKIIVIFGEIGEIAVSAGHFSTSSNT